MRRDIDIGRMAAQLVLHEGLRTSEYLDTVGARTIGVGYNVTGRGVREFEETLGRYYNGMLGEEEAVQLCRADIFRYGNRLEQSVGVARTVDPLRYRVLLDMFFNMGHLRFPGMLRAVEEQRWVLAAGEMMNSEWAPQVKGRGIRLAKMMATGEDFTS